MACQFSIPVNNAAMIIANAERAITGAGGKFSSLGNNGSFEISLPVGKIHGEFSIDESQMDIHIHGKPLFIPCGMIEQKIREYLNIPA
jgi:hypothetical protein